MTVNSPGFDPANGVKTRAGGGAGMELSFDFPRTQRANLELFMALAGVKTPAQFVVNAMEFFEAQQGGPQAGRLSYWAEEKPLYEEVGEDKFPSGLRVTLRFFGVDALRLDRLRAGLGL